MASKKAGKPKNPSKVAPTRTLKALTTRVPTAGTGIAVGSKKPRTSVGSVTGAKARDTEARAPKGEAAREATEPAVPSGGGVEVGDAAPSFVLQDDTGHLLSSESLRGAPYVLYFYPRDDTPGCTLQACGFRDSLPRFAAKGVRVIGVSPDSPESHARFKKKYGLKFPLLSDPEKTLAKAYGVWVKKRNYGREYLGVERSTFHVDRRGNVRQVWRAVRVPGHVDAVIHAV